MAVGTKNLGFLVFVALVTGLCLGAANARQAAAQSSKVSKGHVMYNCRDHAGRAIPVYYAGSTARRLSWASASLQGRIHLFVNVKRFPDIRGIEYLFMFYANCEQTRRSLRVGRRLTAQEYGLADCLAWRRLLAWRQRPSRQKYRPSVIRRQIAKALRRYDRIRAFPGAVRAQRFLKCPG